MQIVVDRDESPKETNGPTLDVSRHSALYDGNHSMIRHAKKHQKQRATKTRPKPQKKGSLKSRKSSTKKKRSKRVQSEKVGVSPSPRMSMKLSQIEIYDQINDDDLELKREYESTAVNVHRAAKEEEEDLNDDVLLSAKRPYYVLIALSVLFLAAFSLYFVPTLKDYAHFNEWYLVPSSLSMLSTVPFLLCFRYFERRLLFQHKVISRKIEESFSLRNQVQSKWDENVRHKKYIEDLKLAIKEQEFEMVF